MPRFLRFAAAFLFVLAIAGGARAARTGESFWYGRTASGDATVNLYFFWSETCPHCARARAFMPVLRASRPWLRVKSYEVTTSAANRELFQLMARSVGKETRGVPAFFLCRRQLVGFDTATTTGAGLAALVDQCRRDWAPGRPASAPVADAETQTVDIPFAGSIETSRLSLPVLTLVLGGVDAFNPCAFFVLLFLLSLLVHARSRARMLLVGGIYTVFSGVLYFVFMAAWLNLFLLLEGIRPVTVIAGVVAVALALFNIKDFFFFERGPSLSIPGDARPGLFARMRGLLSADNLPAMLAGTVTLAVAANTYELLCTSGFPLVFTRALTLSALPVSTYYAYLAFYNVIYVLPLLVIVLAFTFTLGSRKLSEKQGRLLKMLSGLMMLGLGLVLLVAPHLLDNWLTAVALLAAAVIVTGLSYVYEIRRGRARR